MEAQKTRARVPSRAASESHLRGCCQYVSLGKRRGLPALQMSSPNRLAHASA